MIITDVVGGYVPRPNVTGVTYHFLVNGNPVGRHERFTINRNSGRITYNGTGLTSRDFESQFVRIQGQTLDVDRGDCEVLTPENISGQAMKLFQITPYVNDFQTLSNPGSRQPVVTLKISSPSIFDTSLSTG